MKLLDSKIFEIINSIIFVFQSKFDKIRQNSFLLSNIDVLILLSIFATYVVCLFSSTEIMGVISFFVPVLVVLKVLITKGEKIELEHCNLYLILYLMMCLISNFTSSMLPQSIYGFMKTLIYFAFYFALCQFLKNNKKYIVPILFVIASIITFEGIIGIWQNSVGVANIATWQDTSYVNPEHVLTRVYGTLKPYNPNLFAAYLIAGVSSIFAFCALFLKDKKYKSAIVALLAFSISVLTILLTGSRGSYMALFAIFIGIVIASFQIVFVDLKNDLLKKIWRGTFGLSILGSIIFLMFNQGILHRLMSIFILRGDSSTSFRMNVYNSSIQMFQDNWLFGIGVGNKVFREIYGLYMLSGFDALSSYCVFLEMALESGIFALIFYLLFIGTLFFSAVKRFFNSSDYNLKVLLFITFVSILAVMVHGIVDTVYFRPQVQYIFWTMVAILTVLLRKEKIEK